MIKEATTAKDYNEMLNVLPPIAISHKSFLVGEPSHHDEYGRPCFEMFTKEGEDYWYRGAVPVQDFTKEAELEKQEAEYNSR